jgi:hypothetical protein
MCLDPKKENYKKISNILCCRITLEACNVKNLNKGEICGNQEKLERYDNFYEYNNGNIYKLNLPINCLVGINNLLNRTTRKLSCERVSVSNEHMNANK